MAGKPNAGAVVLVLAVFTLGADGLCADPADRWAPLAQPDRGGPLAFGGGRFVIPGWVSDDGVAWRAVADPVHLDGIAWDGERFVAVAGNRALASVLGETWEVVAELPEELAAVTSGDGVLLVATLSGDLWRSEANAAFELVLEDAAEAPRLDREGGRFFMLGGPGALWSSSDGVEWSLAHSGAADEYLTDVAFTGTRWVAVGARVFSWQASPIQLESADGVVWTRVEPAGGGWSSILWTGERFVSLDTWSRCSPGGCTDGYRLLSSEDARTWSEVAASPSDQWRAAPPVLGDGRLVLVGSRGEVLTSGDGLAWTPQWSGLRAFDDPLASELARLTVADSGGGGRWWLAASQRWDALGVTIRGGIAASEDGWTWRWLATGTALTMTIGDLVATATGSVVAVGGAWPGSAWVLRWRPDGSVEERVLDQLAPFEDVTEVAGVLLAVGYGVAATSPDGVEWTPAPPPGAPELRGVASDGEQAVAVGTHGALRSWTPDDGWRDLGRPTGADLAAVTFGHGLWVAVGADGTIVTSGDGVAWQTPVPPTDRDLARVVTTPDGFLALSSTSNAAPPSEPCLLASSDGSTWTTVEIPNEPPLDIAVDGDDWILGTMDGGWRRRPAAWRPASLNPPGWSVVTDAAHADGLAGAVWRTDLVVHNPGPTTAELELAALGAEGPRTDAAAPHLLVRPGRSVRLDDVVQRQLGLDPASVGLGLWSSTLLEVAGRTFNTTPEGSWGQGLAAVASDSLDGEGERLLFPLAEGPDARSNLTVASLGAPGSFTVTVELFAGEGTRLDIVDVEMPPTGRRQLTRVLRSHAPIAGAWARLRAADPAARWTASASAVDNRSGDAATATPAALADGELWLPAVAQVRGAGGVSWRSDLALLNPGGVSARVRLELRPRAGGGGAPTSELEATVPARGVLELADVVGTAFATEGVGWLRLVPLDGPVAAASRTYTTSASGTAGQFIPAVPASQAIAGEARLPWLTEIAGDEPWRTNLGLLNPDPAAPLEVAIELVDGDSSPLGTLSVTVPPATLLQLDRVLRQVTGRDLRTASAILRPADPNRPYFAYASLVEGRTGDAVYLPAAPGR